MVFLIIVIFGITGVACLPVSDTIPGVFLLKSTEIQRFLPMADRAQSLIPGSSSRPAREQFDYRKADDFFEKSLSEHTRRALWHFETHQNLKGSPMTCVANNRQYVVIAAGSNVLSFALPPKERLTESSVWQKVQTATFNHHQFGLPVSNVGSGNTGTITSTFRSNRQLQHALRLTF